MKVQFRNPELEKLYTQGRSKKYRLQNSVKKKFFMRIQQLEAATIIYDLWKTTSLQYKKLQGHEKRYSVRLDRQWRLEFEIEWENEEKTIGQIFIIELSKHYGE